MTPYKHMAVFAAVAHAGSFSAGARTLGLAKSAVSRMVAELEAELGISLFSRTTRRMALTEPGSAFYERCARMVAEADQAAAALQIYKAAPSGRLRVSAPLGLARHVVPALAAVSRLHPALEFDIRLEDRYANLISEDIDVAVRGGHLEDSSLIARALAPVKYVVCSAPSYLHQHGIPKVASELSNHSWISHEQGPSYQLAAQRRGRDERILLHGKFQVNSGPAVLDLLRAGLGVSLTPMWEVTNDLEAGVLQILLPDYEFKNSSVFLISPAGRHRLPKVIAFGQMLMKQIEGVNWDRIDPKWIAA